MITKTNTQLLEGLANPSDQAIWRVFDSRYRPVIERFARRAGLSDEDAVDVAQESLAGFARDFRGGMYDRQRGRLRSWLFGIARNRVADVQRLLARQQKNLGEHDVLERESAGLERVWEQEWRAATIRLALEEVRQTSNLDSRTLQAFELVVLASQSPRDVAVLTSMSVDEVYVAKSRVLSRIRSIVAELEREE